MLAEPVTTSLLENGERSPRPYRSRPTGAPAALIRFAVWTLWVATPSSAAGSTTAASARRFSLNPRG